MLSPAQFGALAMTAVSFLRKQGPMRRAVRLERRCSMTLAQTTSCGYGSRIALRLCGTTEVDLVSNGRDDGRCSSLRAKRSNPWHVRKEDGLLRCARNDGCGDGRTIRTTVIPRCAIAHRGCALGRRPGIHNHGRGLWIPGSMLRIAPE